MHKQLKMMTIWPKMIFIYVTTHEDSPIAFSRNMLSP